MIEGSNLSRVHKDSFDNMLRVLRVTFNKICVRRQSLIISQISMIQSEISIGISNSKDITSEL